MLNKDCKVSLNSIVSLSMCNLNAGTKEESETESHARQLRIVSGSSAAPNFMQTFPTSG